MHDLPELFRRQGWWLALVVALGLIGWDALARAGRVLSLSRQYGVAVHAPALDPASPTGFALARRTLVLPTLAQDAQHWIMQTQAMVAAGDVRVRRVDYDNAPAGRDVHWSSAFRSWLLACAWGDHLLTATPFPRAIERAVLWANPLLFALLLGVLAVVAARSWGGAAASILVLGCVGAFPFAVNFLATNGDHHGLVLACVLTAVLALLLGTDAAARPARWFTAAGVAGGVGLWVSAATMIPVLIGIGLGGFAAAWIARTSAPAAGWPWRRWAAAGAATSLAAYLVEYAPGDLGWRLEVNHPLYALAWLGSGELLARFAAWASRSKTANVTAGIKASRTARGQDGDTQASHPRPIGRSRDGGVAAPVARRLVVIVSLLAVLAPPLAILAVGDRAFRISDPFLQTLHARAIAEFQSLPQFLAGRLANASTVATLLLIGVSLAFLVSLWRRLREPRFRAQLAFGAGPAVVMLGLAVVQIRWWGAACGLVLLAVSHGFSLLAQADSSANAAASRRERGARQGAASLRPYRSGAAPGGPHQRVAARWRMIIGFAVVPGLVAAATLAYRAATPDESDVLHLAERDVAHRLRLRAGVDPLVIAAGPDTTTAMLYHASARGLGTLYWENRDGLVAAAEFFSASSEAAAHELATRHGITHVLLFSWDPSADDLVRAARQLPAAAPLPADTFLHALRSGAVPDWLRPIPHRLPDHPVLHGQQVRLFEVAAGRPVDVVAAHTAIFLIESGEYEAAARLERELAAHPRSLIATATLAGLQARRRDAPAFKATVEQLLALLPEAPAPALEEDIRVAMVLAVGGRNDDARRVLRTAVDRADERALRRLTPAALGDFVALSEALGVGLADASLRELAAELQPPR